MKKLAFIILVLVWPLSYYFRYIQPFDNQLIVDYFITFGYCIGTSILALSEARKEANKWVKHMFWYVIFALGGAIVLTYLIDMVIDDLFSTSKIIWSIIIAALTSLCIYLFKRN